MLPFTEQAYRSCWSVPQEILILQGGNAEMYFGQNIGQEWSCMERDQWVAQIT